MKVKNADYLWQAVLTATVFFLIGLFTGHHSPHWGLAAGTMIAGGVTWLYRKYKRVK